MFYTPVNIPALLSSALASMVIGFIWYSPVLFGKPWMKLMRLDAKKMKAAQKDMPKTYGLSFVATLVTAFVLSQFISSTLTYTLNEGLLVGFLGWLGFTATALLTGVLFNEMPVKLFLINSGYQLASMLAMSTVLTLWI